MPGPRLGERFDAVVVGAGPSGLTAAYCLAREGRRVVVVERSARTGGLMAGFRHGDFHLDLGRKELYSRFQEVHDLWSYLLGGEYRVYPHRIGLLYRGRILEKSSGVQALPLPWAARIAGSFLWSQVRSGPRLASNLEDDYLLRYGRAYYDTFVQGFTRKFEGRPPRSMPPPHGAGAVPRFDVLRRRLARAAPAPPGEQVWRHPARGTGQIIDSLEAGARAAGASFLLGADVLAIHRERDRVRSVSVQCAEGDEIEIEAGNVIASLPLPRLIHLLRPAAPAELLTPPAIRAVPARSTLLVYLFAHGAPLFPHNWLEVGDPALEVGRIVNYAAWNGAMTPPGQSALCLEYFCLEGDRLLALSQEELAALALDEAGRNGLVDRGQVFDTAVVRLPDTNAATDLPDWEDEWLSRIAAYVRALGGLYETNRPGTDHATLAGIDAARACRIGAPMSPRSLRPAPREPGFDPPLTPSLEMRKRLVTEMVRLSLWYVRQLLGRGEIAGSGIVDALTCRVNLYRLTTLWDGRNDPARGHVDPEWERRAEELARLVRGSPAGDTTALEERGLALLWPLLEPRLPQDVGLPTPRPFGCWRYDLAWAGIGDRPGLLGKLRNRTHVEQRLRKLLHRRPAPSPDVSLHFENVHTPRSPFEDLSALALSLRALIVDCRATYPAARTLWCDSWLNNHIGFYRLFPESWKRSGRVQPPGNHYNWWGQFITQTGDFHQAAAARFRASGGRFLYPSLLCHGSLDEIDAYLAANEPSWRR